MSEPSSGLKFHLDATDAAMHHLKVGLRLEGPFTARRLVFRFPRWVPGSYFLREPIQHMFDFSAVDDFGSDLNWKRVGVDGLSVQAPTNGSTLHIQYTLLANELSVRSNHLDTTHLHMMPPFTWMWPEKGIDAKRLTMTHQVELVCPGEWTPATQLRALGHAEGSEGTCIWQFSAIGRDMLLDSILEANANHAITALFHKAADMTSRFFG